MRALLAKYVLIVEGRTEFDALPAAARTLSKTDPQFFKSLEALGVAVIDAKTDSQIAPLGHFFRALGKTVFAVFDKQDEAQLALIRAAVDHPYESQMRGFESVVLQENRRGDNMIGRSRRTWSSKACSLAHL